MSTPILYNKITPNIKKPLLALGIFIIGFILTSAAFIFTYHYGIAVPQKDIMAVSSFILLFLIYSLFTYDSDAGFKFPYFIQKYLIDPKLRHDLEDNHPKTIQSAEILDIQASSKSTYALLLKSSEFSEPEWFQVNLNLMFPKLYFFQPIHLETSCIGQYIDIEYLDESKVILNLAASDLEPDLSMLASEDFFCAVPKNLQRIPSQFLLDFQSIQKISVQRDSVKPEHYQLICKTAKRSHVITSTMQDFTQLETALSTKIDWTAYSDFKNQPEIIQQDISINSP